MKRKIIWLFLCLLLIAATLAGCEHFRAMQSRATMPDPILVVEKDGTIRTQEAEQESTSKDEPRLQTEEPKTPPSLERTPVKVKGIYVSAYVAGTPSMMESLIEHLDETEANAMVIDVKDDYGRVVFPTDSPLIQEIGSVKVYIPKVQELIQKLHEHGIYVIARVPAFRDAWLGNARPEWCVKLSDGAVFRDRDGNAWVNPYKREAWDYLTEIGIQAKALGFDEIQFDYVRFCTEKRMKDVVFDEADTQGRSRADIIVECMEYMYKKLTAQGLFVSADVFGASMSGDANADSLGQLYGELAKHLDYISPMIYPSHYSDGNYGIDHPDLHPYETITAALMESQKALSLIEIDGGHVAQVRPWLQDFTATWLTDHLEYGPKEVRQQIQATYDCGYDEWLLWDAYCKYSWDGLLAPKEAEAEAKAAKKSRAADSKAAWTAETPEIIIEVPVDKVHVDAAY